MKNKISRKKNSCPSGNIRKVNLFLIIFILGLIIGAIFLGKFDYYKIKLFSIGIIIAISVPFFFLLLFIMVSNEFKGLDTGRKCYEFLHTYSQRISLFLTVTILILFIVLSPLRDYVSNMKNLLHIIMFVFLVWFAKFIIIKQIELSSLVQKIENLLNFASYNPIFSTKDTFKEVVKNLSIIKASKHVLGFANKALDEISKMGFMQLDITFAQYTEYLIKLLNCSEDSILGTYTTRPKEIYEILENAKNEIDNQDAESDLQQTVRYIKKINIKFENMQSIKKKKIRIMILSCAEILKILTEAQSELSKGNQDKEIPEISWFLKNVCINFKVWWTTDDLFRSHFNDYLAGDNQFEKILVLPNKQISDHAYFDKEIIITWRKNIENLSTEESFGTLLINWTDKVSKKSDIILRKIEEIENGKNYQKPSGLFDSFEGLVKHIGKNANGNENVKKIKELFSDIESRLKENEGWDKSKYKIGWDFIRNIE